MYDNIDTDEYWWNCPHDCDVSERGMDDDSIRDCYLHGVALERGNPVT